MRQFIEVIGDIDYRNIRHEHGERFIQACQDGGNRSATVAKKIGALKRLFQLAVEREQLEDNPFRYVRKPVSIAMIMPPISAPAFLYACLSSR